MELKEVVFVTKESIENLMLKLDKLQNENEALTSKLNELKDENEVSNELLNSYLDEIKCLKIIIEDQKWKINYYETVAEPIPKREPIDE